MSKLILTPHTSEFVAKHPVTGSTNFGTEENIVEGRFTVAGMNSPEFYAAINVLAQEETEDDLSFGKKALAGCITGWKTSLFYCDDDGKPIEYSVKAALELVTNPNNFWFLTDLRGYVEDSANFFS